MYGQIFWQFLHLQILCRLGGYFLLHTRGIVLVVQEWNTLRMHSLDDTRIDDRIFHVSLVDFKIF